ncbi:DUF4097 family beta strand repeat protein [Candidatus Fermentibacteria bacterium]|nr:DUF4097 family beta strand repeat protein [Candidatus Fermentibacteria bacterium]
MHFRTSLAAFAILGVWGCAAMAADTPVNLSKPASPDGSVKIENVAGSIRVVGWDMKEIKVTGTAGEGVEAVDFTVSGSRATIEVKLKKGFKGSRGKADLEISIPKASAVVVETVSADIDVSGLERSVDLESVSGSVTLSGRARDVKVETVSGNVTLKGAIEKVKAESVSGTLRLQEVAGEVDASTVSGAIEVLGREITGASCESVSGSVVFAGPLTRGSRYSFDSFSGNVTLRLPADTDADVSMSTFSGKAVNEIQGTRVSGKDASFVLGDGGAKVTIDTFSGNALIEPLTQ